MGFIMFIKLVGPKVYFYTKFIKIQSCFVVKIKTDCGCEIGVDFQQLKNDFLRLQLCRPKIIGLHVFCDFGQISSVVWTLDPATDIQTFFNNHFLGSEKTKLDISKRKLKIDCLYDHYTILKGRKFKVFIIEQLELLHDLSCIGHS